MYATPDRDAVPAASPNATAAETPPRRARASIEAARHVVLRRLAPALKHDMVSNLQAVSMMAEMMNARLDKSASDTADLQANIAKLNRLAREAMATCLRVSSWIDPGEDDTVALHLGVQECTQLMAGGLNFRGFMLMGEVPPTGFEVCRGALRTLLASSLVMLADTAPSAGELHVHSQVLAQHAILTVTCVPAGEEAQKPPVDPSAPRIDWNDVQALAAAEQAELLRTGNTVTIRLPRAVPSSPLRMAPL